MSGTAPIGHDVVGPVPPGPVEPLLPVAPAPMRSAAEEARTLVAGGTVASLATLTEDGYPWASLVTYGATADGAPVLYVSTLAEHGRNLKHDARASLVVAADAQRGDPLDTGRVTLLGRVHEPGDTELAAACDAHLTALPGARVLTGFGDFTLWVLGVERVRWVGGYGRMDSTDAASYAAAAPDPVAAGERHAVEHLNADHADALLLMARNLGGHPDASAARCLRVDRYGIDLRVETPRGDGAVRIGFSEVLSAPEQLRAATVDLAQRARSASEAVSRAGQAARR